MTFDIQYGMVISFKVVTVTSHGDHAFAVWRYKHTTTEATAIPRASMHATFGAGLMYEMWFNATLSTCDVDKYIRVVMQLSKCWRRVSWTMKRGWTPLRC